MSTFVIVIIALSTIAFIISPFFVAGERPAVRPVKKRRDHRFRPDVSEADLEELELDYALGKLSEEDYRGWREAYAGQVVPTGPQIEDIEAEIEREVEALRRKRVKR